MEQEKIARINALAKKAKGEGLTPAETAEQAALRKEYLAAMRESFKAQLAAIVVEEPDGTRHKLVERGQKPQG